ncbi:MAG: TetR/AcrR family transcriptional regulator [Pseudomonadota bacterium]
MRDRLLDAAQAMVQDRGIHAVSFQHLADAVGLSKPSVFHHFPNKDALAVALIERCQTSYAERYQAVMASNRSAPEKLDAIAALFEASIAENHLCLLAALGLSAPVLPDDVNDELEATANAVIARYTQIFEQGRDEGSLVFEGSPAEAAMAFLGTLQGLQVLARARRDVSTFRPAARSLIGSLTA